MHQNKDQAIKMRKKGFTYNEIVEKLQIPKTTLHYWFKDLSLPESAQDRIKEKKSHHLVRIRELAAARNTKYRLDGIQEVENIVKNEYKDVIFDKKIKELLLCFLYLGEGVKKRNLLAMGNSNASILRWFIHLLESVYGADRKDMKLYLFLRSDQDEIFEKEYWSHALSVSTTQFGKTQFDKRTLGKKTFVGYHGVCAIYLYDTKAEVRLTALQKYIANLRV